MVLGGLAALAATVGAMPTQEQVKKAEPLVVELMREDQAAIRSGRKTRSDVAESALALADKAETEAEKLLLIKGAFKLYVRDDKFDEAIEMLQKLQATIPDIPLTNMASIIESELHHRKNPPKNGEKLYQLKDEIRLRARYMVEVRLLERDVKKKPADRTLRLDLAEHYAYLEKWDLAIENFTAAGGKVGAIAKSEREGGAAAAKAADFWWDYSAGKADELEKCFRAHAAKFYADAISAGALTGLSKVQAERRIAEAKEHRDNVFGMTFGTRSSAKVSANDAVANLKSSRKNGKALYCIIDLSGGPEALSYPVSYVEDVSEVPGDTFNADEYKTTKLVLRRIEPGKFMMCGKYEVTLTRPYYIGIFEVTQKQYELVTGKNPAWFKGDMRPVEKMSYNMIRGSSEGAKWPSSAAVDADSFMGKIRARTGLDFDLPTEAQWEYVCRAGTTSKYNNGGDSEDDLKKLGRFALNQESRGWQASDADFARQRPDGKGGYSANHTVVGSYLPNAWGLYDLHGNVWEWCLDGIGDLSGGTTDPKGSSSRSRRVLRGGSWNNYAGDCTSFYRIFDHTSFEGDNKGFRLCCSATLSPANAKKSTTPASQFVFKTGVKPGMVTAIRLADDCDIEFVYCPAGEFTMGYECWNQWGKDSFQSEARKQHQVKITKDFMLGKFPVTYAQWYAIMGGKKPEAKFMDAPVGNITVPEMEVFCEKLTAKFKERLGGKVFRLPTEAEWEYASKGGKNLKGMLGKDYHPGLADIEIEKYKAVFSKQGYLPEDHRRVSNAEDPFYMWNTLPVGKFNANEWGFNDMIGNAREVTADMVMDSNYPELKKKFGGHFTFWNANQHYSPVEVDPLRKGERYVVRGGFGGIWAHSFLGPSQKITVDRNCKLPFLGFRVCIGEKFGERNDSNMVKFPLASNVELEMIKCPAGEFTMGYECWKRFGTPFNIESRKTHQVILTKDFMLGKFPVTYAQWHAVMGKGEKTSAELMNTPVGNITVAEMEAFCEKLTAKFKSSLGGKVFRLPTEAEWEYASKGGQNLRALLGRGLGPYDRDKDKLEALWAKLGYKAEDHERDSSTKGSLCKWKGLPVGKFDANEWGFKDMIGNVIEVTADMVQDSRIPADWNKTTIGDLHPWSVEQRYSLIEIDPLHKGSRQVVRGGFFGPDNKMTIDRKYALPIIGFRLCVGEKLGDWNNAKPANAKKQTTSVRQLVFKTGVKPGTVTTIELADDYDMEFAYCPAGKFKMGYEGAEKIAPLRDVTISYPFWMLKRKVTPRMLWEAGVPSGAEDVTAVMHELKPFNKFISFLNKKYGEKLPKGYVFRLVTEAEYEYVSKAESKNGDPRLSWGCEGSEYKPWGIEGLFQGKKVFQDRISADKLTSDITDVCLLDYSSQPKTDPLMWCEDGKYCCLRRAPKKQLRKLVSQPRDNLEGGHLPGDEFHLVIAPSVNALNKFNCNKVEQQW
jgi:formylglycine-generating enzyme required for sulfatase activity